MTGSGTATGPTEAGELRIEVRTVNSRGLLIKQRLCSECSGCETAIEELVRRQLQRGTVTLVVERLDPRLPFADRQLLRTQLQELRALAAELGVNDDLGLRDLVILAGQSARGEIATVRELRPRMAELVLAALRQLQQRREAEGASIVATMLLLLDDLAGQLRAATARAPELSAAYRDRLLRRINEFLATQGLQLQAADVVREVALYSDRVDVSEELQRLLAHLAEVRSTLVHGGDVGRRLEFLLQELLREANTLGSKSPDVAMAHTVVAMKSCIDRLKEQAANLE